VTIICIQESVGKNEVVTACVWARMQLKLIWEMGWN